MKRLLGLLVVALVIPAVVGCGGFRRQAPKVVYRPVSTPSVCQPQYQTPYAPGTYSTQQPVVISP